MAAPPFVEPNGDEDGPPVHGRNVSENLGDEDEQALRARIVQLEADVAKLQGNLATQEAATQRAITSDGYMLAEVQRASEQLLCEHSTFISCQAWFDVMIDSFAFFCSCPSRRS